MIFKYTGFTGYTDTGVHRIYGYTGYTGFTGYTDTGVHRINGYTG